MIKIGLYDQILVYMSCPYCHKCQQFDAQTKDLDNSMWTFDPLHKEWFKKSKKWNDRNFRLKLPVFPKFPKDKSAKVWKNQTEFMEAEATVPKEFNKLKYITVIADCHSFKCQMFADLITGYCSGFGRSFEGKIKIKNGKLIGEIYDIKK